MILTSTFEDEYINKNEKNIYIKYQIKLSMLCIVNTISELHLELRTLKYIFLSHKIIKLYCVKTENF